MIAHRLCESAEEDRNWVYIEGQWDYRQFNYSTEFYVFVVVEFKEIH